MRKKLQKRHPLRDLVYQPLFPIPIPIPVSLSLSLSLPLPQSSLLFIHRNPFKDTISYRIAYTREHVCIVIQNTISLSFHPCFQTHVAPSIYAMRMKSNARSLPKTFYRTTPLCLLLSPFFFYYTKFLLSNPYSPRSPSRFMLSL